MELGDLLVLQSYKLFHLDCGSMMKFDYYGGRVASLFVVVFLLH